MSHPRRVASDLPVCPTRPYFETGELLNSSSPVGPFRFLTSWTQKLLLQGSIDRSKLRQVLEAVRYLGQMWAVARLGLLVSLLEVSVACQRLPAQTSGLLQQAEIKVQVEDWLAAESLLRQLLAKEPNNTDALFRLGYVEYRQRKLGPARLEFGAVVRLAPPAYNSRYFLGRIALLDNKPKEAVTWLEPVVSSGETIYDSASQLAKAYAATGEFRKAAASLKAAISATPWDGALYYRVGQLYKQAGEVELANEAFASSARLKAATREDVEILMHTSELILKGKVTEALVEGARILDRTGADPDALVALGVIYGNSNLAAEALKAFERAAARDADLFQAQFNRGLALMKLGQASKAIAPLQRAFQLLPQSQEAAMTLGLAAAMNHDYAEAIAPLELAWKRDSSNARLGALLGTAYLRSGSPSKAIPILRATATRAQDEATAHLLLIEALDASGEDQHALEAALLVQKQFPRMPESHMAAAQQLVKAGNYQQARSAFEQVLSLAPGRADAELGLADSLQKAGEHQTAIDHYRAAGNSLPARLGQARSLVALRQLEEARKLLEEAVPEHPSDVTLRVELARIYTRLGKLDLASEQTKMVERLRSQSQ